MKVDVLTVNEVNIGKFRWWSDWIDIAVFDYGSYGYLLQMRVSRTNKKSFRAAPMRGYVAQCSSKVAGNLTQMIAENG